MFIVRCCLLVHDGCNCVLTNHAGTIIPPSDNIQPFSYFEMLGVIWRLECFQMKVIRWDLKICWVLESGGRAYFSSVYHIYDNKIRMSVCSLTTISNVDEIRHIIHRSMQEIMGKGLNLYRGFDRPLRRTQNTVNSKMISTGNSLIFKIRRVSNDGRHP